MPDRRTLALAIVLSLMTLVVFSGHPAEVPEARGALTPAEWNTWAARAWNHFATADVGYNQITGLPCSGATDHCFGDRNLATYIFAVLDAERLSIIAQTESTGRLDKIRDWLLTRQLSNGLSYLRYDSDSGLPRAGSPESSVSDYGALLVSFFYWKTRRPEYGPAVYAVIARENSGIARLASTQSYWDVAPGIYRWYAAQGFRLFGYWSYAPVQDAMTRLNQMMDQPGDQGTSTFGVYLPLEYVTSEPLLLATLTLPTEITNMTGIYGLAMKSYLAQENRYKSLGTWTAWSEGNTGQASPDDYVYQWIMTTKGSWQISRTDGKASPITPIAFVKVAFGFHALYGTKYSKDLINYLASFLSDHSRGLPEGVNEGGTLVTPRSDRTQMIVLAAARYATLGERGTSRIVASVSPNPAHAGSPITVTGTLYGTYRSLRDGGLEGMLVKIRVQSATWSNLTATVTLTGGTISKTLNAPTNPGSYTITLSYDGDANFAGSVSPAISLNVYTSIETTLSLSHRFVSGETGGSRLFQGYLRRKDNGQGLGGFMVRLTIYSGQYSFVFDLTTRSDGYYEHQFTANNGVFTWAESRFAGSGTYLASYSSRIYAS